jgi:nicotinate-nucleotide adenylyltransferase
MKAGLFGGTFNPLHNGHINVARHVKQQFNLDTIFVFPAATPPHKTDIGLAPARDRYDMVVQSLAGMDGFTPSDIEVLRKGPSFTIDTIHMFQQRYGDTFGFYLMMGSDAFFDTPTWKNQKSIFSAVPIIVMLRKGPGPDRDIGSFLDEHISKGYTWDQVKHRFVHDRLQPVCICSVPKIDISSTLIRSRVKQHRPIKGLVPSPVEEIIIKRNLYL